MRVRREVVIRVDRLMSLLTLQGEEKTTYKRWCMTIYLEVSVPLWHYTTLLMKMWYSLRKCVSNHCTKYYYEDRCNLAHILLELGINSDQFLLIIFTLNSAMLFLNNYFPSPQWKLHYNYQIYIKRHKSQTSILSFTHNLEVLPSKDNRDLNFFLWFLGILWNILSHYS